MEYNSIYRMWKHGSSYSSECIDEFLRHISHRRFIPMDTLSIESRLYNWINILIWGELNHWAYIQVEINDLTEVNITESENTMSLDIELYIIRVLFICLLAWVSWCVKLTKIFSLLFLLLFKEKKIISLFVSIVNFSIV